jgi:hypothetical protein
MAAKNRNNKQQIAIRFCCTEINALTRTVLATRTPYVLEFTEKERGKTVYVAICWQNEKGECSPWSEIESAIAP